MTRDTFVRFPSPSGPTSIAAFLVALLSLIATGCGNRDNGNDATTAMATLAITAAPGVGSAQVRVTGATRTANRCAPADGQSTTLQGLPTGQVVVTASAFASADCTGDAGWAADPVAVTLVPGRPMPLRIVFRPNGIGIIETVFEPDGAVPLACGPALVRVPREAMAVSVSAALGTGLTARYDDGDVRQEGPLDFGPYDAGNVPSYYPADQLADSAAPALWRTIWGLGGETLTGQIVAPRTGVVEFMVSADDFASMDLGNGMLSIEADNIGVAQGRVLLQQGTRYDVSIRYANRWGSNWFRWYWSCPTEAAN